MLKNALRDMNRRFPRAGLPKPTMFLNKYGLTPRLEFALENLGIMEYSEVTYPANGGSLRVAVRRTDPWHQMEIGGFEYKCIEYLKEDSQGGEDNRYRGGGGGLHPPLLDARGGRRQREGVRT